MRSVILVVTLLGARIASAQPDPNGPLPVDPPAPEQPEDMPPAAVLFQEGRTLLEAGNAAEACSKFEESYKLEASAAGTMLNLGLCKEQLGKLATALKWFRRAQTRAAETNLADTESAAREKSAALAARVATIRLEVTAPVGRTVTLDGVKIDEVEAGHIELDAGYYVLELVAPGSPTVRRELDVIDGKATTIPLVTSPPPAPKKYEMVDLGATQRRRSNLIGAAGVALVVSSGVVGLVGKLQYNDGESPKDWDRWKTVVRYGGSSLFVLGAAAVTYAVVLRRTAPGKERREVIAAPVIAPGHLGFALARSF